MRRPSETAILDATERLLARRRFSELAVGDIIEAAGVSRTSFYAHFGSRAAVLAACLRRVVEQVTAPAGGEMAAVGSLATATPGDLEDLGGAIRATLRRWVDLAAGHGALLRTVSEEWPHDAELRDLWFATIASFAAVTAEVIERARAAGIAPAGVDAQALATVLVWGCERVLHVHLVGGALGLDAPGAIVEPLAQMMERGVLGAPAPDAPAAPH